ncbi:hypothetical protein B0H13DRAFT_1851401 [Mycena leptocephala]|nr:hypothetical protein B0H13DRAFT_1851401 [Mycena leptocephala]
MAHQCALDETGSLKDASDVVFYESESDEKALPAVPSDQPQRRSSRKRQTDRLTESLAAQHADDDGNAPVPYVPRTRATNSARPKLVPESLSEAEDEDYPELLSVSDSEDDQSDSEFEFIDNDEASLLLLQLPTFSRPRRSQLEVAFPSVKPQTRHKSTTTKRKQSHESANAPPPKSRRTTVEEVEDEDDVPKATGVKNPIYLFYESVPKNAEGRTGKPGDKHDKCRHGNRKIITISKASRFNVGKLTTHLKNNFPIMYRLFCALYTRKDLPPTQSEVDLAHGDIPLDGEAAKEYLGKIENATSSILKGLERQAKKAQGNFEQEVFNNLLAEWIVACDQSFDEVEKPEFIRLMEYTHHGSMGRQSTSRYPDAPPFVPAS